MQISWQRSRWPCTGGRLSQGGKQGSKQRRRPSWPPKRRRPRINHSSMNERQTYLHRHTCINKFGHSAA
eukprot:4048620-Lingulodinium_polyedra.AAC.1